MISPDTIAAISSAVGAAARMIVRISGPQAHAIADGLCALPGDSRQNAVRTTLGFAALEVPIWLYRFCAPHSYTGEDVAEFHLPGGPLLARMLLDELRRRGTRHAQPGEFTARAYFNGRMDLTEAEGVAATIAAHGEQELVAARQLMAGELARRLRPTMECLAETLALVEAGIDFSEEDIAFVSAHELSAAITRMIGDLQQLAAQSARFERLSHEPEFVLIGRPNAGKSTLLNALAGEQRALVSPIAGTTRDVIWAEVPLERGLVRLTDLAGLSEEAAPADDASPEAPIATQMRRRALAAIEAADFVVLVHDATDLSPRLRPPRRAHLVVLTKLDLAVALPPLAQQEIAVSAKTGQNLQLLRARLGDMAFGGPSTAGSTLALNSRHLQAIAEACGSLSRADEAAGGAGAELVALELREALDALGGILGQVTPEDVLGKVFSRFCIGK